MNRRLFLRSSGIALAGLGFSPAFARRALGLTDGRRRKVLVTILQRGAVDGLSMVPPVGESRYHALRPGIAIPRAGDGAALALDGPFGLHPALAPLERYWNAGALAVVHSVGSPDATRSHFDAQDYLESGTPGVKSTEDGYLNRALQALPRSEAPFRAVGFQPNLPRSLSGRAPALAMSSLSEFSLRGGKEAETSFESMYARAVDAALKTTGDETFDAVKIVKDANPARFTPQNGASYPASPLGKRLQEIAQLIRADVGLEIAATDCGGWDTHAGQGSSKGQLANRLQDFGASLAAFATDLGDALSDVCVVTMTEFGRTVRENGTRGTDHGHGSVMLVLGGGVKGKRVLGKWKGLADADLHEGRDLAVTTDHRDVLAEVLRAHLGVTESGKVFPGFQVTPDRRPGLFGA